MEPIDFPGPAYRESDPIVERVCFKFQQRSTLGVQKYGTTLAENPLEMMGWLRHLQEELMDGVNYIERLMFEVEKMGEMDS